LLFHAFTPHLQDCARHPIHNFRLRPDNCTSNNLSLSNLLRLRTLQRSARKPVSERCFLLMNEAQLDLPKQLPDNMHKLRVLMFHMSQVLAELTKLKKLRRTIEPMYLPLIGWRHVGKATFARFAAPYIP